MLKKKKSQYKLIEKPTGVAYVPQMIKWNNLKLFSKQVFNIAKTNSWIHFFASDHCSAGCPMYVFFLLFLIVTCFSIPDMTQK